MAKTLLSVHNLQAWFHERKVLDRISLNVLGKRVLAIIGPKASGKSSLLRCLNRLFEEGPGHRVEGEIFFNGENIYSQDYDVFKLRRQFSMVFSEPTTFSHLSIFENIALGLRLKQVKSGAVIGEAVEGALVKLGLWEELKDQLHQSPHKLNEGKKQLICLARSLVLKPKIILMDEATSMIGARETMIFEGLIRSLGQEITVIFTTSSWKQAARVSNQTAFMLNGELIEVGKTSDLFMNPRDHRTEDYITGRFG